MQFVYRSTIKALTISSQKTLKIRKINQSLRLKTGRDSTALKLCYAKREVKYCQTKNKYYKHFDSPRENESLTSQFGSKQFYEDIPSYW